MGKIRITPVEGQNMDLANDYFTPNISRFIKNLSYQPFDTSEVANNQSGASGKFKPFISNEVYDPAFTLPAGKNQCIGSYGTREENYVIFHNWNKNAAHGIYRLNGATRTVQKVYEGACLNYQIAPQYFVHEGGAELVVLNYSDPNTGLLRKRSFYQFTDGFNDFRYICLEDSIATNGFDATLFPYFAGTYDKCLLINAGVPTPDCCITVTPVANTTPTLPNNLKYKTWKFYIRHIDVYGRMSEWSDPSDLYVPGGGNNCLNASDALARCLDLTFCAGNPLIDKIDIAYTNCDNTIGYKVETISLYQGSNLGDWWLRPRNPDVQYNSADNTITYRFCDDKECVIVPAEELSRTENPMPRVAQSVAKIGSFIALGNNKHGFHPFGDDIMKDVSVSVTPGGAIVGTGSRNIEILVPIYNPQFNKYSLIFKPVNGSNPVFGLSFFAAPFVSPDQYGNLLADWGQAFGQPDQYGFIGTLAGTNITTVSEQYYVDANNNLVAMVPGVAINITPSTKFYQRFYFAAIKPGQYVFRILGQAALLSDANKNRTSTYTAGRFGFDAVTKLTNFNAKVSNAKELSIDVCFSDYSSLTDSNVLVIYDLAFNDRVVRGYVYEATTPSGTQPIPVELAKINVPSGTASVRSAYTDHNGFYFASGLEQNRTIEFYGIYNCSYTQIAQTGAGNVQRLFENNIYISDQGYARDFGSKVCSRVLVKGRVTLCGTTTGVAGVPVVLTRGGTAVSGQNGEFTIVAHDEAGNNERNDALVYSPANCPFTDCNGACVGFEIVVIRRCSSCVIRNYAASGRSIQFISSAGLLSGGRYGVGLQAYDWLGRHGFVQTREPLYFTVPTIVDARSFAPAQITLNIAPSVLFPSWVRYLRVMLTQELGIADYIEWIVDRFELVDNTGSVNTLAPTQIKIYYASLLEYNKQNNFNTTAQWAFSLTSEGVEVNYTNDYVEFYVNGDGNYFPSLVRSRVKYDKTGQYFLIDYDSALANLKANALIRLARPSECVSDGSFRGLCAVIKVVNGVPDTRSIVLDAYDTYSVYRSIPVPVPISPTANQNVLRSIGFPFEHHSPSDFWGDHCANYGKPNVRNPYEAEILFENQIALSGALSANGQLNYLNYFSDALVKNFNSWNFGGIVSMLPQTSMVMIVCQYDTFVVGFDDNLLRSTKDGIALSSGENEFGRPERKVGSNYGCRLFEKNTIRMKDGLVEFVDANDPGLIKHNFQTATKVSLNGADGYIRSKLKYIAEWNRTHVLKPLRTKFFVAGIDGAAKNYVLSDFELNSTDFGNDNREPVVEDSETILFNYTKDAFRGFASFVPEYYASLESNTLDMQLFSFANGIPYFHYTTDPNRTYNTFFGKTYSKVLRVVGVIDPYVKKKPLAMNVLCPQTKYFIDQAVTDSNQQTRVLLEHWKKGLYYTSAPLLCDLNTLPDPNVPLQTGANKLLDGDMLYGSIVDIRLVSDPAHDNEYSELLGVELYTFEASPTKQ